MSKQWPFSHYIDVCHCNVDDFEWKNISLIYLCWMDCHWYSVLHLQKVSGRNTKWLYVKLIINEQTMAISPLYWCMPWNVAFWAYNGPFIIVIILIWFYINSQNVLGRDIKWFYVKVTINEQTMTISPLYWCMRW